MLGMKVEAQLNVMEISLFNSLYRQYMSSSYRGGWRNEVTMLKTLLFFNLVYDLNILCYNYSPFTCLLSHRTINISTYNCCVIILLILPSHIVDVLLILEFSMIVLCKFVQFKFGTTNKDMFIAYVITLFHMH